MKETHRIGEILTRWNISLKTLRKDIAISGSPERTDFRIVFEDTVGRRWLLEKVPHRLKRSKLDIIHLLKHLARRGFEHALPYKSARDGAYHVAGEDGLWQLLPFLDSIPLDRPRYVFDDWRGEHMARSLASLRRAAEGFSVPGSRDFFSITDYITDMAEKISRHTPGLVEPLRPILTHLEHSFFDAHSALPTALCHGDYHPLNIIWQSDGIGALIDWEFFGLKPEGYDVANMLGCLGMEDPDSLSGGMALVFLEELKAAGFLSPESLCSLPDLTLALRFAWLSEWLRKGDAEMIGLELTYMHLLLDNREKILDAWTIK
jgi:homoserine kinase type II